MRTTTIMDGVREYCEGYPVELFVLESTEYAPMPESRVVFWALNEAGNNSVHIDALDLLGWVKRNRPDLWETATLPEE